MAERTYQTLDSQNVTPNFRDSERSKLEIDNHINSILGAEYFGKADGFMAAKHSTNIIRPEGFPSSNQGFYSNSQGRIHSHNQTGLYSNSYLGGNYGNSHEGFHSNRTGGVSENPTPYSPVTGGGRLDKVIKHQLYKEHKSSVDDHDADRGEVNESIEKGEYSSDTEVEDEYEEDTELTAALNTDHSIDSSDKETRTAVNDNPKTNTEIIKFAALNPDHSSGKGTGKVDAFSVNDNGKAKVDIRESVKIDQVSNEAINSKMNESMRERILGSILSGDIKTGTPSPSKKRSRKQPASTIKRKKQEISTPTLNDSIKHPPTDEEMPEAPDKNQRGQNQTNSSSKRKRQRKSATAKKVKQEPPDEYDDFENGANETEADPDDFEVAAANLLSLYTKPKFADDDDPSKPHKCSYCNRGFRKRANLNRHILTHTGERPFSCEKCGKTFSTAHAVKLHDRQHTGDKPYQCEKCLKKFTYYANYKIHLGSHSNERPFPCVICGRAYTMATTLKRHMKIHSEDKPWKCDQCPKQFAQEKQLKNHMVGHSSIRPFACNICDRHFAQTYDLGKHMLKHAEQMYVDDIHPDAYKDGSVAALEGKDVTETDNNSDNKDGTDAVLVGKSRTDTNGIKLEIGREKWSEKTEEMNKSKEDMDNMGVMGIGNGTDMGEVTKTPLRQSRCKVCKEVFVSLKQHMRVHMDRNPFYCTLCRREFLELTNLKQHMTTHTGAKPYSCEDCGRGFAQASNLKSHMRIHTGERPFVCPVCQKTFAHSSSMKNHVRFHTGEVCHYCQHCGRGFTDKSSLKKHVRTHTGEKPYTCAHCGRGFAASSSLKTHMFTHSNERPYKCDQGDCVKQFARPSQLQKHLLNRHKIDRLIESMFENEGGPKRKKTGYTLNLSHNDDDDDEETDTDDEYLSENEIKSEKPGDMGDPDYVPTPADHTMSSKLHDRKNVVINQAMDDLNPLITQAIKQVDERGEFNPLITQTAKQVDNERTDLGQTAQLPGGLSSPEYVAVKIEPSDSNDAENSYTGGMLEQTAMPVYRGNV